MFAHPLTSFWTHLEASNTRIEKIRKVKSPTLVIHGMDDDVIPFIHGQQIFERAPKPLEPLWLESKL